jgi:hypothetical protein
MRAPTSFEIWRELVAKEIEVTPLRKQQIIPEFDVYVSDLNEFSGIEFFRSSWLDERGSEMLLAGRFSLRILEAVGQCQLLEQSVVAAMANVLNAHEAIQEMSPRMRSIAAPMQLDSADGRRNNVSELYRHCADNAARSPAVNQNDFVLRRVQTDLSFSMYVNVGKFLIIADHYSAPLLWPYTIDQHVPNVECSIAELRAKLLKDFESKLDLALFVDQRVLKFFWIERDS